VAINDDATAADSRQRLGLDRQLNGAERGEESANDQAIGQEQTRMRQLVWSGLAIVALAALTSCSSSPPPRLRTPQEINAERVKLPVMYLTDKTGKKVLAPMNSLPFVDKATNEVCCPAYYCTNPDCPGKNKGTDGDPYLFVHADPLSVPGPDGQVHRVQLPQGTNVYEEIKKRGGYPEPTCPECYKLRHYDQETRAEKQRYRNFVKPYYPPETVKRLKELDDELTKWNAYVSARKSMPLKNAEPDKAP
jgi:hypothetical protein